MDHLDRLGYSGASRSYEFLFSNTSSQPGAIATGSPMSFGMIAGIRFDQPDMFYGAVNVGRDTAFLCDAVFGRRSTGFIRIALVRSKAPHPAREYGWRQGIHAAQRLRHVLAENDWRTGTKCHLL